ncbi:hypothetical protein [Symbioplanes lichenis]|uniref:hypothetical protein n=1 Tax=Symbioplanes lichenis TaxID=1629072 RepID=UPI00273907E2|nr:hypothetical protein [Actinoplanes lichenis]
MSITTPSTHPAWCDPRECDAESVCHFSALTRVEAANGEAIGVQLSRGDGPTGPGSAQPTCVDLLAYTCRTGAAVQQISLAPEAARRHARAVLAAVAAAEGSGREMVAGPVAEPGGGG